MVGDFTKQLGRVLGCEGLDKNESKRANDSARLISDEDNIKLSTLLPRLYIDGPFGSASEDVFKFETVLLIGAGIGVTPFASILKSIWYRMNDPSASKTRLRKVYFFWVCRDFGSLEWFKSLLTAIESEDKSHAIEIHAVRIFPITPLSKPVTDLPKTVPDSKNHIRSGFQHCPELGGHRCHHRSPYTHEFWTPQLGYGVPGNPQAPLAG